MSKSNANQTNQPMRVVKLMIDDGRRMLTGTPLDLDGDVLLIDSGQEIEAGTTLRLVPIADDDRRTSLFEFEGVVENTFVDVLVSAYADNRFILAVRVSERGTVLRDLEAFVAEARATRRAPRKRRSPHRSELLASAFWAATNPST
jgi:hypothetical protein